MSIMKWSKQSFSQSYTQCFDPLNECPLWSWLDRSQNKHHCFLLLVSKLICVFNYLPRVVINLWWSFYHSSCNASEVFAKSKKKRITFLKITCFLYTARLLSRVESSNFLKKPKMKIWHFCSNKFENLIFYVAYMLILKVRRISLMRWNSWCEYKQTN